MCTLGATPPPNLEIDAPSTFVSPLNTLRFWLAVAFQKWVMTFAGM
jgi:hypothetical protein